MKESISKIIDDTPTIALVGRVNVGKSTLFNRLIEKSGAIISEEAGTTRTRNISKTLWRGKQIRIIDTGGFTFNERQPFEKEIEKQVEIALKEADLVAAVVDARVGPLPQERKLISKLTKKSIPVILIVNKVDNERVEKEMVQINWRGLGIGEPIFVSASSGRGTGELLDKILELVPMKKGVARESEERQIQEKQRIKVAIVGRPNVGKSSLFNALIGEESVIVSPIPHTTREPFDTDIKWGEHTFTIIDTAGIRKTSLMQKGVESFGVRRSIEAIKKSDVALLVIDVTQGIAFQDKFLAGEIEKYGTSVIIILNKSDEGDITREYVFGNLSFLKYASLIFVSAKTKKNVHKILPQILRVASERAAEIPATTLEGFLHSATKMHLPIKGKGTKYPKILSLKQTGASPPVFEITIKYKTNLQRAYLNYLENRLRQHFGFTGTPIFIKMKKERR